MQAYHTLQYPNGLSTSSPRGDGNCTSTLAAETPSFSGFKHLIPERGRKRKAPFDVMRPHVLGLSTSSPRGDGNFLKSLDESPTIV